MKHARGDELVEERDGWEAWISADVYSPNPAVLFERSDDDEMVQMWRDGEVYMIDVYPPGSGVGDRSHELSLCGCYGYSYARNAVIEMLDRAMAEDQEEEKKWLRAASL